MNHRRIRDSVQTLKGSCAILSKDFENQRVAEAQAITGYRRAFCNPLSSKDCSSRDRLHARCGLEDVRGGAVPWGVRVNGESAGFSDEVIGRSHYAVVENLSAGTPVEVLFR